MDEGRSMAHVSAKVLLVWCSLAVFVICLTALFLGMRTVLDLGGSCASGGPYEIENPCPQGGGWILPISIWLGLAALAAYVFAGRGLPGPKLVGLAWPALFLSLGWNFLEFGFNPPEHEQDGGALGLIVCGVIFVVMGIVPLVALLVPRDSRRWVLWSDAAPASGRKTYRDARSAATGFDWRKLGVVEAEREPASDRQGGSAQDGDIESGNVIDRLERLSAMHRRGDLTADEFAAAKSQVLDEGRR